MSTKRIEIRPSEGGDDALLFANELAGGIARWADSRRCSTSIERDGTRNVTISVQGDRHCL